MADDSTPGDIDDRLDDLEARIEALRAELRSGDDHGTRRPSRGEALRLTEEYAIPAAITALEANVRMLELLREAIRARSRGGEGGRRGTVTESIERAFDDLERALEGSELPGDREARGILTEVRRLNDELRERLSGLDRAGPRSGGGTDDRVVRIDVESELDEIRESVEDEADDDAGDDSA